MATVPYRLRPRSLRHSTTWLGGVSSFPQRGFSNCRANLQEAAASSPARKVSLIRHHPTGKQSFQSANPQFDDLQPRWIKKVPYKDDHRMYKYGPNGNEQIQQRQRQQQQRQPKRFPATRETGSSSKQSSADVEVVIDGEIKHFSSLLVRDLCQCSSCVDQSTKQKLFSTADIPPTIRPQSVQSREKVFSIRWEDDIPGYADDHVTNLDMDVLRSFVTSGTPSSAFQQSLGPKRLWEAKDFQRISDIDYEAYMQDDAALYQALQQLHNHGLLFLSKVPDSEKSVSTIAERIGPVKNTFYGYTWDVRSVPEAKNVAYTSQDLGFHMDLLYMEQPPHLQFLHCIRSSSVGGASLFTDSYKSASDLFETDINAFDTLSRFKVTFHYNHPDSHLYKQLWPVLRMLPLHSGGSAGMRQLHLLRDAGKEPRAALPSGAVFEPGSKIADWIDAVSWSPPFQGPFQIPPTPPHDSRAVPPMRRLNGQIDEWHKAAQEFSRLIHRPEAIYERLMKPGECVLFDNRRVLHARRAFDVADSGKERWLRGAYLDKDPYLSKLRVLQNRFEKAEAAHEQTPEVDQDYFKAAAAS